MSREDVEVVKSSLDSYSAGERDRFDEFFAEDVEVCPDASRFPEAAPFRGREELKRFLADVDQAWEGGGRTVIREVFPAGERVVVRADWGGKGRTSGIELRSSLTTIYTVRDGLIVKLEFFFDDTEALEAVGLRE